MEKEDHEILEYYPPWKLQDFGLGRGINGTDPQPWVNKSALQIRDVIREAPRAGPSQTSQSQAIVKSNLIGTNEGGVVHHFVQEVTNIKDQKAKLSSSIIVPNSPVSVGVGAELSRSLTTTQKVVGRRVINRTVAFTMNYNEAAEEQLASLIIDTADWMDRDPKLTCVQMLKGMEISAVEKLFEVFIHRYRVTHYVSSISMGASTFTVQSASDYNKGASVSADLGVSQVAQAKVSASYVEKTMKKSKNVQKVGKLNDDGTVEKEAVVDVKMEPISSIFQSELFSSTMKRVLKDLFTEKDFGKEGPYLISCNDATVFLKVVLDENDRAFVYGTTKIEDASNFNITLTDEYSCPYEFYIGWQKYEASELPGTTRYLNAPLSMMGYNYGPLSIESRGKKRNSIFSINSRLIDTFCGLHLRVRSSDNMNPEAWFKGLDSFLISCSGRTMGRGGFIAMQRNSGASKEEYRTICKGDASGRHSSNVHMTFQLHPKDKKNNLIRPVLMNEPQASSVETEDQEQIQEIEHKGP